MVSESCSWIEFVSIDWRRRIIFFRKTNQVALVLKMKKVDSDKVGTRKSMESIGRNSTKISTKTSIFSQIDKIWENLFEKSIGHKSTWSVHTQGRSKSYRMENWIVFSSALQTHRLKIYSGKIFSLRYCSNEQKWDSITSDMVDALTSFRKSLSSVSIFHTSIFIVKITHILMMLLKIHFFYHQHSSKESIERNAKHLSPIGCDYTLLLIFTLHFFFSVTSL